MARTKTAKETTKVPKSGAKKTIEITEEQFNAKEEVNEVPDGAEVFDEAVVTDTPVDGKEEPAIVEDEIVTEVACVEIVDKNDDDEGADVNAETDGCETGNEDSVGEGAIEELEKKISEYSSPAEKLETIVNESDNIEESLKEELARVEKQEEKLKEDIKKTEEKLSSEQRDKLKDIFRYGFGNYWNGQSSGW